MPEWFILMVALWFFFGVSGRRSCGRSPHRLHRHGPRSLPRPAPPSPPETAERRLQREFVEGRLSLEEYEAALWRELGPKH